MTRFDPLPEQPSSTDQLKRFGPPALLAIVAILFIVQNTDSVKFEFLWMEFDWPLWIMLVAFMVVGAAVFYFVARRRSGREAREKKRAEKDAKAAEKAAKKATGRG